MIAARLREVRWFAHRGLWAAGGAVENSLAALHAAARRGYGVELDVRLSRDGEPVVFHDPDLRRLCGRDESVRTLTVAELAAVDIGGGEGVPTLAEALAVLRDAPTLVEIKVDADDAPEDVDRLCRRVDEVLGRPRELQGVIGFSLEAQILTRRLNPERLRGLNLPDAAVEGPSALVQAELAPHMLVPHRSRAGSDAVQAFRRAGGASAVWTVRSAAAAAELRDQADAVIFEGFRP